jgi:hypothetical protein
VFAQTHVVGFVDACLQPWREESVINREQRHPIWKRQRGAKAGLFICTDERTGVEAGEGVERV